MRAMRIILLTALALVLMSATAYGTGMMVRHFNDDPSAAAAPASPRSTASSSPGTATPGADQQDVDRPDPEPRATPEKPADVLAPGDKGEKVRDLQYRLFQLAWLPEKTTGSYDTATVAAVKGFQAKRDFKATGTLDAKTWKRLAKMSDKPTHDQMFNVLKPGPALLAPGASGDGVRDLQARLKQIDWFFGKVTGTYGSVTVEAVKGFQAKRSIPVTGETDQRTMDRLHAMTSTPSEDAKHNVVPKVEVVSGAELDPRCTTGRVLCIDKSSQTVRWVVDGKVVSNLQVRFGSAEYPTREGQFSVTRKSRDHVSSIYHTSMPLAMFFSGGQAVHFSPDFAANGYSGASHGCVNVRDYNGISTLFDQVSLGDKVIVYWS